MYVQQIFTIIASPVRQQEVDISLASFVLQYYQEEAESMSTDVVQFLGMSLTDQRIVGHSTVCSLTIRLRASDMDLVDKFLRTLFTDAETPLMRMEVQRV